MRLLGVTMAYNEADCVGDAIELLLAADHDEVHLFDHGSTDGTGDIAYTIRRRCSRFHYHHISRTDVPPTDEHGRQSRALWERIGGFIRARRGSFDWATWIAADEIVREPDGSLMSRAGVEREAALGVEVIRPLIRCFWITRGDPPPPGHHAERLRWYKPNELGHAPRAWRIELTPNPIPIGLHVQDRQAGALVHPWYGYWPEGTVVSNNEWILDHYPIRSIEQGRRKVMHERSWVSPAGRRPYEAHRRDRCQHLVRERRGYVREDRDLPLPSVRPAVA